MKITQPALLIMTLAIWLSACAREEPAAADTSADEATAAPSVERTGRAPEERLAAGKRLYSAHCAACHQADGQGLGGAFPPLAASDYLADGPAAAIDVVLNGLNGPITVNGVGYNAVMPNLAYLSDRDVADIVTFVMNSWNNPGGEVSPEDVAAARKE